MRMTESNILLFINYNANISGIGVVSTNGIFIPTENYFI